MIDVIMQFGTDIIMVRVKGNSVSFGSKVGHNPMMATIDGLKLSRSGVIKEFPELADTDNWREEAIAKFKDKIKGLNDENKIVSYVVDDLSKFGYKPLYKQKQGMRIERFKT